MARRANQDFGTDRIAPPTRESGDSTQQSPALATLVHASGQVHPLLGDLFYIGRDKSCHIQITGDTSVSRKHASIRRSGVTFVIEDNHSSNGVYINGAKIEGPHELRVGEKVEIGKQVYEFRRR
jgi:pSer/pThr/pTyr-binding forkhead associated (FHA) protein